MSKYISVDELQEFCNNQTDHCITPNDFQRMHDIDIVRCKDCKWYRQNTIYPKTNLIINFCELNGTAGKEQEWYCADGVRKE